MVLPDRSVCPVQSKALSPLRAWPRVSCWGRYKRWSSIDLSSRIQIYLGGEKPLPQKQLSITTVSSECRMRDFASSSRMWPQGIIFVALPHLGPILVGLLAPHRLSGWCNSLGKLSWCPPHKILLLVWTIIYSVIGYASYLVWKDLGRGFGRPLALPLGLYAAQLAISWTSLMLLFIAHTPGLALLHLLLLFGLVVSMALVWHPVNKLAALLLLPYLAWLTVTASITYHLWRDGLCPEHQPQPTGEKSD